MRKLKHSVWYVSLAFMVAAIAIGSAPISSAQEQPAPSAAEMTAAALPGVTVTEVHEGHLHYGLAAAQDDPNVTVDPEFFSHLSFRPTGFNRGGRATAVTGIPDEPFTFFAGYTGGGVWKTADAGTTWENISDGYFNVGSIGDIKVAPSDPNVIWVGTGSGCPRGNISTGDGIYRSTDGGKSWAHVWSPGYVQIPEMVVHPEDPDHLYAAVLGNIFGPGEVRGIYETKDGGQSWEQILFVSNDTGFNDIEMHPSNPRILFASAWTVYRKPWTIHSGSDEGGIFRSKDAGVTWEKLEGGLPGGMVGKIDVSISPANPDRAWALIEAANDRGGVYRTDNGGDNWTRVNDERSLQQRAWYYTHIYADPVDPDTVYALNTGAYKSTDGGRTFDFRLSPQHGDNHDLWLNPNDPNILVNSNDGGANVSLNGGRTFSTEMNQPTAEFYRVTVDNAIPYRVYGAQQDNSTASVQAAFGGGGRGGSDFYSVGGGESGHIAVDPRDANVIWAGSYGGNFTRMDRNTGVTRSVRIYADAETGQQAADMKYRFQWNAPIRVSPHDPNTVYITSQYVHRTQDQGVSWEVISPDLTTNNPAWQGYSGGEGVTRDSTGVEVYTTVFAFEESPLTPGLLWAGSDDGLIHISRDNGVTWDNITPPNMVEGGTVNQIDMSMHDPGRATVAVYKYREQDFHPYIYQTNDYGQSWRLLTDGTNGIPADHFVRTVREDPNRRGLLFAGTEFGLYVSFDDGAHWQSFQLNLPITPVTDMTFKDGDLVLSTQGRAFWVLDNMTSLSQLTADVMSAPAYLFAPRTSYRSGGNSPEIQFYIADGTSGNVTLEIANSTGEVVSSRAGRVQAAAPGAAFGGGGGGGGGGRGGGRGGFGGGGGDRLVARTGMNSVGWNGSWPSLYTVPPGIVQWGGGRGGGPAAAPGNYTVTLTVGDWSQSQTLEYRPDPRISGVTQADYEEQVRFAREVGAEAGRLYDELAQLRSVKEQATRIGQQLADAGYGNEAMQAARNLSRRLEAVEGELTQLQGNAGQDALNFPGRLDNQLNALYGEVAGGNPPVQRGAYERWEDIKGALQPHVDAIHAIYDGDLAAFNELVGQWGMRVVMRRNQ